MESPSTAETAEVGTKCAKHKLVSKYHPHATRLSNDQTLFSIKDLVTSTIYNLSFLLLLGQGIRRDNVFFQT